METLYSWQARRAGAGITLSHSTGKIVNVTSISVNEGGQVVAVAPSLAEPVMLSTQPHRDAETERVNMGVSDLFFNNEQACEAYRDADGFGEGDEPTEAMVEAAETFQTTLRAAGLMPPTVAALWADFAGRV